MICPPAIVANRRSLATRIAVTFGTASFKSGGIGPLAEPGPAGEDAGVAGDVAGLSARRGGSGAFIAGGVPFGYAARALTAGAGTFAGGSAPVGRGAVGGGTFRDGAVPGGCTRLGGTLFVAADAGGYVLRFLPCTRRAM